MKVLIADDEVATRDFVARALEGDGHDVVAASDGLDAWSRFENDGPFDLLLSDISMPGMDGVSLAERVLATTPQIKVILMSGLDAELERVDNLAGHGVVTLTKPFSLDDVRALVRAT